MTVFSVNKKSDPKFGVASLKYDAKEVFLLSNNLLRLHSVVNSWPSLTSRSSSWQLLVQSTPLNRCQSTSWRASPSSWSWSTCAGSSTTRPTKPSTSSPMTSSWTEPSPWSGSRMKKLSGSGFEMWAQSRQQRFAWCSPGKAGTTS